MLQILSEACSDRSTVDAQDVIKVLAELEEDQSKLKINRELLEGTWELVLSTSINGYMPVRELINFQPTSGTIDLNTTAELAGGRFSIPLGGMRGACSWGVSPLQEQHRIHFSLNEVKLGPFKVDKGEKAEAKHYDFVFLSGDGNVAVAKSSGGSLALLGRVIE
ncbi:unnamed protein product [Chrysoparadoxa australica]